MSQENLNTTTVEKKTLSTEQAIEFIEKNMYVYDENFKPLGGNLGCIDDRADEVNSPEKVAIPGSALGILLTMLGTVKKLEELYGMEIRIDLEKLASDVESVTGISLHTDQHSVDDQKTLMCAGCGHCAGILNTDAVGPLFSDFVKNKYLPDLKDKGVIPVVYQGEHDASAVFIINDLQTGLRSKSDSAQAYVYNKAWHNKILTEVAEKVYDNQLTTLVLGLSRTDLLKLVTEVSGDQLGKTIQNLKADTLPQYDEKGNKLN